MEKSMKTVTVGVRMPPELKEKLQKLADEEMRSLSNMIVKLLTQCVTEPDDENPSK